MRPPSAAPSADRPQPDGSRLDVDRVRARFPAVTDDVVAADAPAGTQAVDVAIEALAGHLRGGTANEGGGFPQSAAVDDLVADARRALGGWLGTEPDGIVFGPNMTTLAFHLSHALRRTLGPGDEIVCTRLDHDANVTPWTDAANATGATVRWVPIDGDGRLDVTVLDEVVTDRTRLVTFPRASNALGTLVDPAPVVDAARAVGAVTVMDAVHAAPHVAIDRRGSGVDVLLCSPYKFFGPHAGIMAADPALLAASTPDRVRPAPSSGPGRWQTGTASFEAIAATRAAVGYLDEVGMDRIGAHERDLAGRFLAGVADRDHVTLHGPATVDDRVATFAVTVAGRTPQQVAAALAADGVNVWAGHYYAVEPMAALGLLERGGAVRIGFVHYHRHADVDRVLGALDAAATSGSPAAPSPMG